MTAQRNERPGLDVYGGVPLPRPHGTVAGVLTPAGQAVRYSLRADLTWVCPRTGPLGCQTQAEKNASGPTMRKAPSTAE